MNDQEESGAGSERLWRLFRFVVTVVITGGFVWAVVNAIAPIHPADTSCRDVLYQVNRGPSFNGEVGGREFTCPSSQHFLEAPLEIGSAPPLGVFVCRCKDMHKVMQRQKTEIEMLLSRMEYLEKRGVRPATPEELQLETAMKLDYLERELHKKAPLEDKK